jgi:hypothetical protein
MAYKRFSQNFMSVFLAATRRHRELQRTKPPKDTGPKVVTSSHQKISLMLSSALNFKMPNATSNF